MKTASRRCPSSSRGQGFTLVELLVVIVAIAILAALTVVSYGGITKRAQNAAYLSAVDGIEKQVKVIQAQGGLKSYDYNGLSKDYAVTCVGKPESFPATANFKAGECFRVTYPGTVNSTYYDQDVMDAIKVAMPSFSIPDTLASTKYSANSGMVEYNARGIVVSIPRPDLPSGQAQGSIVWVAPDRSGCGRALPIDGPSAAFNENMLRLMIPIYQQIASGEITPEEGQAQVEAIFNAPSALLSPEEARNTLDVLEPFYAEVRGITNRCILSL